MDDQETGGSCAYASTAAEWEAAHETSAQLSARELADGT